MWVVPASPVGWLSAAEAGRTGIRKKISNKTVAFRLSQN
jgi:hypothetical protein